jgi:hypothetical protein
MVDIQELPKKLQFQASTAQRGNGDLQRGRAYGAAKKWDACGA